MKKCFIGKTGKLYVKNPFDNSRYCYAVYGSADAYATMSHLPTHISADDALADFKEEIELPEIISKYQKLIKR